VKEWGAKRTKNNAEDLGRVKKGDERKGVSSKSCLGKTVRRGDFGQPVGPSTCYPLSDTEGGKTNPRAICH